MQYKYEVLCPPLPPNREPGRDFKLCWLVKRPAFLKIEGGRLSEEGFLKEVRVEGSVSLYSGTWGLIKATLDLVERGKIKVLPLPLAGTSTEEKPVKPITEKQRVLIEKLMEELGEKHPIPGSRKDASMLIQYLLSRKRATKKAKKKVAA